jgi:signal transduction histidine kinase
MSEPARLRTLALLDGLSDDQIGQLAAAGEWVSFDAGDELFGQAAPARSWFLLLDGRIALFRRTGHDEQRVGTMDTPGQWAGGFRAWDEHGVYLATGRAIESGHLLRVPAERLRSLADSWFPLGVHFIRGLVQTVRNIESIARQRESLAALGTLAAGLAHELNNPASAATRAVDSLTATTADLTASLRRLASSSVTADQFVALDALRAEPATAGPAPTPLQLADREEVLADWLADHEVDRDWVIAPVLATAGRDASWCDRVAAAVPAPALGAALEWVANSVATEQLLGEIKEATGRISGLVGAVKDYTHLDRAELEEVPIAAGLDSTLTMLARDLAGVTVVREYEPDAPSVEVNPAEINQVWTHLIRNSIDAMRGSGRLTVRIAGAEDGVVVQVCDTGSGMPAAVLAHAFDPFFTTKGVGEGTGLGLDVSRRIVVDTHGGEITLESGPSGTVARVRLPARRTG